MKRGYLETSLLLLLAYFAWKLQVAMARHSHLRRQFNGEDCHRCPPGFGVSRYCSRHRDTECLACAPNHYSSHHSARRPCYPCSRCGTGLYVAHKCTSEKDTVCDSCHTYKGPHNEDFYERCVRPRLLLLQTQNSSSHTQPAKEGESVVSTDISRDVPTFVVMLSALAIGTLTVALLATCFVVVSRRHCKKVDHQYEAVATQEAIML